MLREFWVGEAEVFVDLEMENNMEKKPMELEFLGSKLED